MSVKFQDHTSCHSQIIDLNQQHSLKKNFLVKSLWNWGYDNYFDIMLGLPNFGQMTTSTIQLDLPDKTLLVTSETESMTS